MGKPKSALHAVAAPSSTIPLELAPLLKPYRKQGKLSLRVERVHQLARLSQGRNNGDGSWSLASDELEDLEYLYPEGSDATPTLSIRIIGVDQDLATLAVIDYPLAPATRSAKATRDSASDPAEDRASEPVTRQQLEELESLKSALAKREAELADLQKAIHQGESDASRITSALVEGRESWKKELEQQLASAAARSASDLERARNAWRTEQSVFLNEVKEREEKRLAEERERWSREADTAKTKAEEAWKSGESQRLAKAKDEWREKSAKALAEATIRCEHAETALEQERARASASASKSDRDEHEHRRLLEELTSVRATLAERNAELADMRTAAEGTQERLRRDAVDAQLKAEAQWRAVEAARLAKAEAEWREKSDRALAEISAKYEGAEAALAEARARATAKADLNEIEHRRLSEELKIVRSSLADREAELARAKSAPEQAASTARSDDAERRRLSEELAGLRALLTDRDAELARARSIAASTAKPGLDDAERRRLSEELASLRTALTERDAELARARSHAEKAPDEGKQKIDAAIASAKAEWKEAERARLTASEAEWRKESDEAHAEATSRLEEAERTLIRAKTEADRADAIARGLRDEIANLQAVLADRESELARLRTNSSRVASEPRAIPQPKITITEDHGYVPEPPPAPKRRFGIWLFIQIGVVIMLVVGGIAIGPNVEQYIPESVWNLFGYTREPERPVDPTPAPAQPPAHKAAEIEALPEATLARGANVHASPATAGDVVTTLERGTKVVVIGQHGNWTHVRIDQGGKPLQEGWVYSTFLNTGEQSSSQGTQQKSAP